MAVKKKKLIRDKAITIIRFLDHMMGHCTANVISTETGISYLTVQKYLKQLKENEIIIEETDKKSKVKKYSLNYDKIFGDTI